MDVNQRIACKAVIAKDGKVLLLREASTYEEGTNIGRYHLPGGRINAGEPFLDGLKREVMEETGLEVEIGEPLFVGEWFPVIKDVQNQIVAIFFVCKPLPGDVKLSEEHDDYRWVTLAEAQQFDVMSPEDKVLQKFFSLQ
jgi:8-oxo-dGTP diphosphatase